jgi:hypothetical protein
MDALGSLVYLIWNATLCVTFWWLLPRIAEDRQTPQVVSYLSLSCGFVLLTFLSVHVVNLAFGSSSGGFRDMGLAIISIMGSVLLSPLIVTAGAIRLVVLNRKSRTAARSPHLRRQNAGVAPQAAGDDVVNLVTASFAMLGVSWIAVAIALLLHGTVPAFKTVESTWPFAALSMVVNAVLIVRKGMTGHGATRGGGAP